MLGNEVQRASDVACGALGLVVRDTTDRGAPGGSTSTINLTKVGKNDFSRQASQHGWLTISINLLTDTDALKTAKLS